MERKGGVMTLGVHQGTLGPMRNPGMHEGSLGGCFLEYLEESLRHACCKYSDGSLEATF